MGEDNVKIAIVINTAGDAPVIELHSPSKEISSGEKRLAAEIVQVLASFDSFPSIDEVTS